MRIRATNASLHRTSMTVQASVPVVRTTLDHPMGVRGALSAIPDDCDPEPEVRASVIVGYADFGSDGAAEVADEVGRILIERGVACAEPPLVADRDH